MWFSIHHSTWYQKRENREKNVNSRDFVELCVASASANEFVKNATKMSFFFFFRATRVPDRVDKT